MCTQSYSTQTIKVSQVKNLIFKMTKPVTGVVYTATSNQRLENNNFLNGDIYD